MLYYVSNQLVVVFIPRQKEGAKSFLLVRFRLHRALFISNAIHPRVECSLHLPFCLETDATVNWGIIESFFLTKKPNAESLIRNSSLNCWRKVIKKNKKKKNKYFGRKLSWSRRESSRKKRKRWRGTERKWNTSWRRGDGNGQLLFSKKFPTYRFLEISIF